MHVHAIIYDPKTFSDDLYERGLALVDLKSAARIRRFFHREDACRTLIGRLLPRVAFEERQIPMSVLTFETTEAGKPYILAPEIHPPIAFNVSHDNAIVVMVSAPGIHGPPAFLLGIDIMKVHLPRKQTLRAFVDIMAEQMTALEYGSLFGMPEDETLRRFFWLWTMKEAYTKALGFGLGFDFRRVEYDIDSRILRVDNVIPQGWRFNRFVLNLEDGLYQGVVALFVGGSQTEILHESDHPNWLLVEDASTFVEKTSSK